MNSWGHRGHVTPSFKSCMKKLHLVGWLVSVTFVWILIKGMITLQMTSSPVPVHEALIRASIAPNISNNLLTLFTTFKNKEERNYIYRLTIKNWASLRPRVQPLLFTDNRQGELSKMAEEYGWKVFPVPRTNEFGTPFVKDMYLKAFDIHDSMFYGYANGDILFDSGLVQTLSTLSELDKVEQLFVTGKRTNYEHNPGISLDVQDSEEIWALSQKGELATVKALDYFIMTNWGHFWLGFPDLVIGRIGYDNYMAATAISWQMITVDATQTLPAIHLQGKNFTMTHRSDDDPDMTWNIRKVGKFRYVRGFINKLGFETYRTAQGAIDIRKRLTYTLIKKSLNL